MFTRILLFLSSFIILSIPVAYAGGLDTVANSFQSASSGWMTNAEAYAKSLFLGLAGLEFAWAGMQYTLKKNDLPDFLVSVTFKVLGIGFFYSLLMEAPTWIPAVMNSFSQAGTLIGGTSGVPMTPSAIIDQGIGIAAQLVSSLNQSNSSSLGVGAIISSGGASLGNYMLSAIIIGLSGLLTIAAFTLVAIQLLVTLIESYVVIGGGMLMLGFLGSRWTLPFGEKYFGYAVSVGIKLFVLYLLVGAGGSLAADLTHQLQALGHTPAPTDYLVVAASSMGYGALGFMAPGLAGSMMNGAPALSMGNMAAAGGGIAGSGVSAAAMGGAALLGGTQAAKSIYDKTMGALKAGDNAAGSIGGSSTGSMVGGISGASSGGFAGGVGGTPSGGGFAGSGPSAPPGMSGGAGTGFGGGGAGAFQPSGGEGSGLGMAKDSSASSMGSGGSGSEVQSKGGTDAIADPKDPKQESSGMGKTADHLNEMARRMDRLPQQDGHSGGISIRLNHTE